MWAYIVPVPGIARLENGRLHGTNSEFAMDRIREKVSETLAYEAS